MYIIYAVATDRGVASRKLHLAFAILHVKDNYADQSDNQKAIGPVEKSVHVILQFGVDSWSISLLQFTALIFRQRESSVKEKPP